MDTWSKQLVARSGLVALALMASGCPLFFDLDGVTVAGPDASDPPDGTMPRDVGPDSDFGPTPPDADPPDDSTPPPDLPDPIDLGPPGMTCPGGAVLTGSCNLVAQDCTADEVCEVGLLMPGVETGCRVRSAEHTFDLPLAATCDPASNARCQPGLFCRGTTCERYCYSDSGIGCEPSQFCAPLDATNLPGVGWCTTACP